MQRLYRRKGVEGSAVRFQLQRRGANGAFEPDSGTFAGDQTLTCVVWPGGDRQGVASLPAEWVDADAGTLEVTFPAPAFADLPGGVYLAAVQLVGPPAVDLVLFELALEESSGTGEERPTYITASEVMAEFPPAEAHLGQTEYDQTGFSVLRAQARDWLDLLILSNYRQPSGFVSTPHAWYWPSSTGPKWVADALASDCLMLDSPNGRRLRLAQVYWVLAKVFRRAGGNERTVSLADYYEGLASSTVLTALAEIDTDGDGSPNYIVDFSVTNSGRGWPCR